MFHYLFNFFVKFQLQSWQVGVHQRLIIDNKITFIRKITESLRETSTENSITVFQFCYIFDQETDSCSLWWFCSGTHRRPFARLIHCHLCRVGTSPWRCPAVSETLEMFFHSHRKHIWHIKIWNRLTSNLLIIYWMKSESAVKKTVCSHLSNM